MLFAAMKVVLHTRRLIGAALLLAVFLLPLHLHPVNLLPQINKDCACYSGARTQLGLSQAEITVAPVIQSLPLVFPESFFLVPLFAQPHPSRAPPTL